MRRLPSPPHSAVPLKGTPLVPSWGGSPGAKPIIVSFPSARTWPAIAPLLPDPETVPVSCPESEIVQANEPERFLSAMDHVPDQLPAKGLTSGADSADEIGPKVMIAAIAARAIVTVNLWVDFMGLSP